MGRSTAREMLTGPKLPDPAGQVDGRTLRPRGFGDDARAPVEHVWALMGMPCGKYLAMMVQLWLPLLAEAGDLDKPFATDEASAQLSAISAAAVDRYLVAASCRGSISFRKDGGDPYFHSHLRVRERGNSGAGPDRAVVGHVVAEAFRHDRKDLLVITIQPHLIGVHVKNVLPPCAGDSQGAFHVAERLGDLVDDRFGEPPGIVPTALTRKLKPVTDFRRLGVVQVPIAGRGEEFGLTHDISHPGAAVRQQIDRKSTRLNSSHHSISYAV